MLNQEQKDVIVEAIELVEQAASLVNDVLKDSEHEAHYEAYSRYGFDTLLGNGNTFDVSLRDLLTLCPTCGNFTDGQCEYCAG